ncbi:26S proteasome regulatory subunit, putative, partial [Rhizoctonia solani AG-3 Rhs1AP]
MKFATTLSISALVAFAAAAKPKTCPSLEVRREWRTFSKAERKGWIDAVNDNNNAQGLAELVTASRVFMSSIAKAKTAKLIRTLIDNLAAIPGGGSVLTDVLSENIAWARTERPVWAACDTMLVPGYPVYSDNV